MITKTEKDVKTLFCKNIPMCKGQENELKEEMKEYALRDAKRFLKYFELSEEDKENRYKYHLSKYKIV